MAERSDITEIRERIDIVELVGAKVDLKRSGKNWKGLCPFHTEKTPSFYVNPERGSYTCFGCGEKGDAFAWLMKTEGLSFPDALEQLAARTGVTLRRGTVRDPGRDELRERVYALNEEAATFYANVLLTQPAGAPGRSYVAERGLTATSVERFGLGFAPDGWDPLTRHLLSRGHTEAQLLEAGLASERESGGIYDRFRARLLFPIRNRDGKIVGFGGRALGDAKPKYLNTAQTAVFDKSANLYAIDLAKEAIRTSETAVIVEGYLDAIMAHQVGYANVVASMGTALTEAQVGTLKRLTSRIILALDADAAGQAAVLRGIETMRQALDYDEVAVPTARLNSRQLIQFERKLKTDILVLTLPEGKDPDEFLRARPADWPALVQGAVPLLDFVMEVVAGGVDLNDARAKSAAVTQLAPLIRELPDQIQQAHYLTMLARMLRTDESAVRSQAFTAVSRAVGQRAGEQEGESRPERRPLSREDHLLALIMTYPEILGEVAADLLAEIVVDDFADTTNRLVWEHAGDALRATPRANTAALLAALPDDLVRQAAQERTAELANRPEQAPIQVGREARETLRLLRREAHDGRIRGLQAAIHDAVMAEDREAVASLVDQLATLSASKRDYAPPVSPYFHDLRTVTERR